jgi:hypothetical protein
MPNQNIFLNPNFLLESLELYAANSKKDSAVFLYERRVMIGAKETCKL